MPVPCPANGRGAGAWRTTQLLLEGAPYDTGNRRFAEGRLHIVRKVQSLFDRDARIVRRRVPIEKAELGD